MLDVIYVALTLALFALVGLVVQGVERLGRDAPGLPATRRRRGEGARG
ncbi:MAG TPA: hypothetical protein VJR25_09870 [Microbacterium sp.]|nr:hypothetical protein [Microbacterium sp.]